MTRCSISNRLPFRLICVLFALGLTGLPSALGLAGPTPASVSGFDSYINTLEARLAQQHRSQASFLAHPNSVAQAGVRLRRGELIIEQLTPPSGAELPGALLHHWRGTAFVAGAKAAEFESILKDLNDYAKRFAPQVLRARAIGLEGDQIDAVMRVRQRHVLTVVMDISYEISFGRLDALHGFSVSRSTKVAEIESPDTASEHALGGGEEHGFLWRLNTYWSFEERDGGLYMQIESVSLTRSIPHGLGWAVGPFVESIPRESLEFTLRSACNALRR